MSGASINRFMICDAGATYIAQPRQFGVISDFAGPNQLIEPDGQRHQPGNPP